MIDESIRILLVDDDDVDRMAIRRALKTAGLRTKVEEAVNGVTAFAALAQTQFDCVFLDYRLPDDDGLALLRSVRGQGMTVPIVMLTGQGDEQLAVELMKAGASDYITKNAITADRLAQSLRTAIRIHRAEQQTAQAQQALHDSVARLRFLAEASRLLVSSLDAPVVLTNLTHLAVQHLADWCAVDMVADDGSLQRLAVVAADPNNAALAETIQNNAPIDPDAPFGAPAVLRTGQSQLYTRVNETLLPGLANHWRALLESLQIVSMMSVPLMARNHTLGVITFATAESGRVYGPDDLSLAEDLANRAAIAIDNAQLYQEARQAIRLRDVFLSVASHELKTPLTSLSGNAQMLERRIARSINLNERDRRALHVIVEQARRLNQMITTLLDVSRIQNGQLTIECTPVDIDLLLKRLIDELTPALEQHTLVYYSSMTPLIVKGDELRLEQVFHNLIQNAVKYSTDGGVIILHAEQQEHMVVVSVTDEGIGIPQSALPYVFNRFYRASNVNAQNISGIGLGLYVVHQIVSLHQGTIDVASEEGRGSTFTVRMPRMNGPAPTDTSDGEPLTTPHHPSRMVE